MNFLAVGREKSFGIELGERQFECFNTPVYLILYKSKGQVYFIQPNRKSVSKAGYGSPYSSLAGSDIDHSRGKTQAVESPFLIKIIPNVRSVTETGTTFCESGSFAYKDIGRVRHFDIAASAT